MYESHFGFSGSPFQLNPDPAFYFDSRGHSNALAYLKFGAHQGEGFIVVTGEIGAGKTTLVRTLLEGLNPEQVVAAQVVSTQLESGELLQAILMSFGIASSSTSKAHLIGTLEAFLTALAAKGRRALLIIDEAQNLKHEAVEELRMLSNFQLGKYGLLQSFLVGQPELRKLLQSKSMEQLRQRVIASCHLGPLAPNETRAYIEHRLGRVGWKPGRPGFDPDSFDRIHTWTGGVPRKINRLCNRMLLGAFLNNEDTITSASVDRTASDLRGEIGELSEIPDISPPAPSSPESSEKRAEVPQAPHQREDRSAHSPVPTPVASAETAVPVVQETRSKVRLIPAASLSARTTDAATGVPAEVPAAAGGVAYPRDHTSDADAVQRTDGQRGSLTVVAHSAPTADGGATATAVIHPLENAAADESAVRVQRRIYGNSKLQRPLVCLVDSTVDFLKCGTLADVFQKFPSLPPLVAVHPGPESRMQFGDTGANELPMPAAGLHLENLAETFARQTCQVLGAFDQLLSEFDPHAVLAMGNSDAILACALLARKKSIPVIRIGGGQREVPASGRSALNGALIDKVADVLYVNRMDSYYTLYQEGIKSDRVLCVGNLIGDMLKHALPHAPSIQEIMRSAGASIQFPDSSASPNGYLLVSIDQANSADRGRALAGMVDLLPQFGAELPVIWVLDDTSANTLQADGSIERLQSSNVHVLRPQGYLQQLGLLENARCLVTDDGDDFIDEASSLRVPAVRLSFDPARSAWVVHTSSSAGGTSDGTAKVIRDTLADSERQADIPAYWDSGTATRIANHLVLTLERSEDTIRAKA